MASPNNTTVHVPITRNPVTSNLITMGKKYQTQSGLPVRILCVDGPGPLPVIGLINEETISYWESDGTWLREHQNTFQLVPIPTKHEGWALVDMLAPSYTSRAEAERAFDEGKYAVGPTGNSRYRIAFYTWEET